jgi:nickel-dependent lactate racemase
MVVNPWMSAQSKPTGGLYFAEGTPDRALDTARQTELLDALVAAFGRLDRVLLVPPDFTRYHSGAGALTCALFERLSGQGTVEVLPALGTHVPMAEREISAMFPGIPHSAFHVHDFRRDVVPLGEVPASFVREVSKGLLDYSIRSDVATRLARGNWDRIISIGQLVPHEVAGIAGQSKNVFIGTGGKDVIDKTHFLGAVCGMEAAMGRARSPVREVLSYMRREFASQLPPITYLLNVRGRDGRELVTRGLFAGDDDACFLAGVPLVQTCNVELLDEAPRKVVAYLDPAEFKSTWLGNKAIYRTRMAVADGGELLVIAPGVRRFGEDAALDRLIRRHGYHGTPRTLAALKDDPELLASLSAAAHLIHGSSEGRFRIRYAAGGLDASTVEKAGYETAELDASLRRYDPGTLTDGFNVMPDGERIYFVSNPALGLWSLRERFRESGPG